MLLTKEVKTKWNNKNRKHFESKGYIFTGWKETLIVNTIDLMPNSETYVDVQCDYCGKKHRKTWRKYFNSKGICEKDACSKCGLLKMKDVVLLKYGVESYQQTLEGRERTGDTKRKYNIEQVRLAFDKEGYQLITKEYVNNSQKLDYICPIHGKKSISFGHFLNGKRCKQCQRERISNDTRYTHEDVCRLIHNYSSKIKILNIDYKGYNNNSIKLLCEECKKPFNSRLSYILQGKTRCDHCSNSQSNSEYYTEEFLLNNNINYDKEVHFEDCFHTNTLSFDYAIYDDEDNISLIIELDGQQHFKPVCFGGMNLEEAEKQFVLSQERDKIKNDYCKENGIPLLRIPYWDFNKIEEILTKELNINPEE